ncbi:UDP-glycosyltransferase 85A5-like [Pyrus ussuriensis x Pyrus communis]|uniref:UDP-glycosyltransferase 85A5-like n=1 Tax=Pyrus ussuriensis x Pyrus communis TaxID=2448454 RepID=A0A5N5H321_9ROSA|nr:UDP-glycosyltransferase 85A5-like [Pyrus ussuriensis x Pyrus communis]
MGRDGTGQDRTERSGRRRRRRRGYNFAFHGCGTSRSRGVRWNENSPKTRSVEQLVPPVLGAPNVGRNALSHSVPSRPTYQTVPFITLVFSFWYRLVCRRDGTERNGTGRDGTGRDGTGRNGTEWEQRCHRMKTRRKKKETERL